MHSNKNPNNNLFHIRKIMPVSRMSVA